MAKTLDQITGELITAVVSNFAPRLIDTRTGTVVKEAFVNPAAAQFKQAFDGLDTITLNQSVANQASMTTIALEDLGENVGVALQPGKKASGFVRFVKFASPLAPIPIAAGTQAFTQLTNASATITFTSLSNAQLLPTSPADPITGAQAYVDVFFQADNIGAAGNVDAGTIVSLASPIAGIDQIFNVDRLANGSDQQSNAELAAVIQARSQGRIGTRPGYKDLILSNLQTQDVLVLGAGDPGITRNQFGGAVDIVILGSDIINSSDVFAYTGQTSLSPLTLPLVSANSLTGFDSLANPITFVGPAGGVGTGLDYDVVLDKTGPFAGSYKENSKVILHFVSAMPGAGTFLTLSYANNELIRTAQSFLNAEDNDVLGSDVLAKAGIEVDAAVTASIRIIPGFDPVATIAAAEAAVTAFFNSRLLGVSIEESQVITAISEVAGVSFVDLPSFVLALASAPLTPLLEIVANNQEFVRVTTVTIAAL